MGEKYIKKKKEGKENKSYKKRNGGCRLPIGCGRQAFVGASTLLKRVIPSIELVVTDL